MYGQLSVTIISDGTQREKIYNLTSETTCIGRNEDNDIVIKNKYVSSHHGYMKFMDECLYYVDRNSVNGTYLNGQYIKKSSNETLYPYEIADEALLFIGDPETKEGCLIQYYKDVRFFSGTIDSARKNVKHEKQKHTEPKPIEAKQEIKRQENSSVYRKESRDEEKAESEGTLVVFSVEQGRMEVKQYLLSDTPLTIGRNVQDSKCDVMISHRLVSKKHATIEHTDGHYWYSEYGTNKFTVHADNKTIPTGMKKKLCDRDILILGDISQKNGVVMFYFSNIYSNYQWKVLQPKDKDITIGRSADSDIVLPQLSVSRNHAKIVRGPEGSYHIVDEKSANGMMVNYQVVRKQQILSDGDVIDILNNRMIFFHRFILYAVPQKAVKEKRSNANNVPPQVEKYSYKGGMKVELKNISRKVPCKNGTGIHGGNRKYILQNVSCTIGAGQLVAILGGSGAGKTTFMNCINGFEPATSGTVKINGKELYKNYQVLKQQIGYVPQQDIVYDELTLKSMLTYVAKLRLPRDLTKDEIREKVNEVIEMVDLKQHANTFIKKLSGGQRKRASIAVELLSDPELFFLDEPTSGLDPEAETNLMKQLRNLSSNRGKTVIVITHTLQNIHLFDKIVFLAPGGRLCFFGSPKEALTFFEVTNLSDAYEKIASNVNGYVKKFERNRRISG